MHEVPLGRGPGAGQASTGPGLESKGRGGVSVAPLRLSSELQLVGLLAFITLVLKKESF